MTTLEMKKCLTEQPPYLLGTSNADTEKLDRIAGAYKHHWPDKRRVLRLLKRRSKIGSSDGNASCCGIKGNS
jgi:hypothetical protein